jgi:hypothetical protein
MVDGSEVLRNVLPGLAAECIDRDWAAENDPSHAAWRRRLRYEGRKLAAAGAAGDENGPVAGTGFCDREKMVEYIYAV